MELNQWLKTDLQKDIWKYKYRFGEETLDEFFDRVSESSVQSEIKRLMMQKKFLAGGRILANKGLDRKGKKVTYSNCYVITPPEDNLESIFESATKLARTYSYGGGCGLDISNLAPYKAKVNNSAKHSSGAVSFMNLFDLVTGLIAQEGRRGALMLSIICTHPDLLEFIDIKNDLAKVTNANISIRVLDAFMDAIKNNQKWELSFTRKATGETITKVVESRELFRKFAENNWDMAEPAMLFWDRITSWTLLSEDDEFEFVGVNPCAEEPLPSGGSCLISSFNFSEYVLDPFTENARFDYDSFSEDVMTVVIYMNDLLDEGLPLHPLQEQRESVKNWRQIGIGFMGEADMFIKMGIRFGSQESLDLSHKLGRILINKAMQQSALLAKDKGTYPKYKKTAILKSPFFIHNADEETKELVKKYGLYNSQLLTIAPTGSISTMLGVSGGGEPIFMISYIRKTKSLHNEEVSYKVYTPIVEEYMILKGIKDEKDLPDYFITAMELDYKERIEIQAVWQIYIDASISSTVNVPNDFTVEQVEDLYMLAWEKGLKGITIYRDGCKRSGILVSEEEEKPTENKSVNIQKVPPELFGVRHKVRYHSGDKVSKAYIHVYVDENNTPIEVWIEPTEIQDKDMADALGRMTTQFLRFGGTSNNVDQAIKHLRKGKTMMSLPSIVARLLEGVAYGKIQVRHNVETTKQDSIGGLQKCPKCNEISFNVGECACHSCGYSKCN